MNEDDETQWMEQAASVKSQERQFIVNSVKRQVSDFVLYCLNRDKFYKLEFPFIPL